MYPLACFGVYRCMIHTCVRSIKGRAFTSVRKRTALGGLPSFRCLASSNDRSCRPPRSPPSIIRTLGAWAAVGAVARSTALSLSGSRQCSRRRGTSPTSPYRGRGLQYWALLLLMLCCDSLMHVHRACTPCPGRNSAGRRVTIFQVHRAIGKQ